MPLVIAATSLAISVPLCFLLIPPYGMNGAAIATSVSYTASMILAIVIFSRETHIPARQMLLVNGDDLRGYVRIGRRLLSLAGGYGGDAVRGER